MHIPPHPPKWNVLKFYSGMEFFVFKVLRDLTEVIWNLHESSSLETQYFPIYRVENNDEMSDTSLYNSW